MRLTIVTILAICAPLTAAVTPPKNCAYNSMNDHCNEAARSCFFLCTDFNTEWTQVNGVCRRYCRL